MPLGTVLAWLFAAFFIVGTVINLKIPEPVRKEYARWGYRDWFHYVTAVVELTVAVLLLFPASRPFGAALGAAVMAAAAGTICACNCPIRYADSNSNTRVGSGIWRLRSIVTMFAPRRVMAAAGRSLRRNHALRTCRQCLTPRGRAGWGHLYGDSSCNMTPS